MFYDELALDDECPMPGTLGALVLEEEERGNTHDLRDLLDRKRQKKEVSSLGSRECVVVWELRGRLIYRLWRWVGLEFTSQEGPKPLDYMMAQEEILEDMEKEAQI